MVRWDFKELSKKQRRKGLPGKDERQESGLGMVPKG